MKFIIISPAYNCDSFIKKHLQSLQYQTYEDWHQIIINDFSSDDTLEIINDTRDSRTTYCTNPWRMYAPYSHWYGLYKARGCIEPEDIIVHIDSDDWLAHNQALEMLASIYEHTGCWGSYGSYLATNNEPSVCVKVDTSYQIRAGLPRWPFSHIRSFRAELAAYCDESWFKDSTGEWLTKAGDVACIAPIFELAGLDRIQFVQDPLLIYNRQNPLNEDKQDREACIRAAAEIRLKKPLQRLESL
jgi:glycosyltransferase involved in cell wall biosynthesis